MRSFGQRLKMPKRYEKRFFNNVTVVLCKKTARKKTKYSRNETIFKIGHLSKAIAHAKAVNLAKCSVGVKNLKCQKDMKNDSLTTLELFCAKNLWKKHQISEKSDNFEKRPSCKGYSACKGFSLGEMRSLGQKLKRRKTCEKQFFKNVAVFLCKKPLEKTPNTREMREF